eukprot:TRINITY_DN38946_c0_g1_i1.p1 TRINITY_DN38946_c0_g1~~TRINITY_DN38946_c0_g1_i1.p1  ORF type:complete len:362 (+),score=98.61 TRINITY_DN38946_c0_g1_i1:59-1144(+)
MPRKSGRGGATSGSRQQRGGGSGGRGGDAVVVNRDEIAEADSFDEKEVATKEQEYEEKCEEAEEEDESNGEIMVPTAKAKEKKKDGLMVELQRLLHEEEHNRRELEEAVSLRDAEIKRAERNEAEAKAAQRAAEDLHRLESELLHRKRAAADEEANWREMAQAVSALHAQDELAVAKARASRADELTRLRDEISRRRLMAAERNVETERQRRHAADERCMLFQAALDFTTGKLNLPPDKVRQLLGGDSQDWTDADVQADRLLRNQKTAHREETRGILALCNQELQEMQRRSSRASPSGLLFGEGLARLLAALAREGLVTAAPAVQVSDGDGGVDADCSVFGSRESGDTSLEMRLRQAVFEN